jgi:hypothetical protein
MSSTQATDPAPDQIHDPLQLASSSKEVNTAGTGSFDYVTTVDERLCCPICRAPMQDPWMSKTCEHFYCYECILQHLTNSDVPGTCPCDRSPLSIEKDKKQLVPAPRLVKLLCDELEVRCTTQSDCKWIGQRCHWDRHVKQDCKRDGDDTCPNGCGYQGSDAVEHVATACIRRPIYCEACQDYVQFDAVEVGLSARVSRLPLANLCLVSQIGLSTRSCYMPSLSRHYASKIPTSGTPSARLS